MKAGEQGCNMMKAKFKENEIGNRKQNGLEQQNPTAREVCKADVVIQQVVKIGINYSPPVHVFAPCRGTSSR